VVCRGSREIKAPTSYSWFLSTTPYTWQNPGPLGSHRSEVQRNCVKYTFPACFMSTAKLQHGLQQKDGCWSCLPTFLLSVALGHLYKPAVQSGQTGKQTKPRHGPLRSTNRTAASYVHSRYRVPPEEKPSNPLSVTADPEHRQIAPLRRPLGKPI